MATQTVGAESVHANDASAKSPSSRFNEAHAEWRYAKAQWDGALYSPENRDKDLPEDVESRLSEAHCKAFDEFIYAPADSAGAIVWKLTAIREEEAYSHYEAARYIDALIQDVRRLNGK